MLHQHAVGPCGPSAAVSGSPELACMTAWRELGARGAVNAAALGSVGVGDPPRGTECTILRDLCLRSLCVLDCSECLLHGPQLNIQNSNGEHKPNPQRPYRRTQSSMCERHDKKPAHSSCVQSAVSSFRPHSPQHSQLPPLPGCATASQIRHLCSKDTLILSGMCG